MAKKKKKKKVPRQAGSPLPLGPQEPPQNIISHRFKVPSSLFLAESVAGRRVASRVCEKVDSGGFQISWVVHVGPLPPAESSLPL